MNTDDKKITPENNTTGTSEVGYFFFGLVVIVAYYVILYLLLSYSNTNEALQGFGAWGGFIGGTLPLIAFPYFAIKGRYGKVDGSGCAMAVIFTVVALAVSTIPYVGYIIEIILCYWFGKGLYLTIANQKSPDAHVNAPSEIKGSIKVFLYILFAFFALVGVLYVGSLVKDAIYPNAGQNVQPTAYIYPTATKHAFPTKAQADCLHWSQVTNAMKGDRVCVYGNVVRIENAYAYILRFENTRNAFYLVSSDWIFEDTNIGSCVLAKGIVEISAENVPYINIKDTLYYCEPWMMGK